MTANSSEWAILCTIGAVILGAVTLRGFVRMHKENKRLVNSIYDQYIPEGAALRKEIEQLREQLAEASNSASIATSEVRELGEQVNILRNEAVIKDSLLSGLQRESTESKLHEKEALANLRDMSARVNDLEAALSATVGDVTRLLTKLKIPFRIVANRLSVEEETLKAEKGKLAKARKK